MVQILKNKKGITQRLVLAGNSNKALSSTGHGGSLNKSLQ
jgi:hypothetical protein